ncbi:T6SS effector BTH_I2691 family protein [Rahnella aquatilis]|uniref:T6SS effector BTH_I2691 family protein n=1 Tax=Rahnella aquatilis TaxID=34038 RepID=UPI000647472B|nr:T6SS effector BTH_I2691 family protein [Rahnella aquatilis]
MTDAPSCSRCQSTGPTLLPARYAVVPDGISASIPGWATPQTAFPKGEGYSYLLRTLRQGFVYAFYESTQRWDAWAVAEDSSLWKQFSGAYAQPKKAPDCTSPEHNALNMEMLALSAEALTGNVWLAFSPSKWTSDTLDRYRTQADQRQKRMQCVASWQWTTPADSGGVTKASEAALNEIADYMPVSPACATLVLPYNPELRRISRTSSDKPWFSFDEAEVRAQGTIYPWSLKRQGKAAQTLIAMQARGKGVNSYGQPITPLVVALQDPAGIAHELAGFSDDLAALHNGWMDELSIEFMTTQSLAAARNQVEQMEKTLAEKRTLDLYQSTANYGMDKVSGIVSSVIPGVDSERKTILDDLMKQAQEQAKQHGDQALATSWPRYDAELNHPKITAFNTCFEQFCGVIASRMETLHQLRISWLETPLFITCCQDFFSTKLADNLSYREIVDYALASLNLTDTGAQWLDGLINQYSAKSESNLVWRSLLLNNPDVIAEMTTYLQSLAKNHGVTIKAEEASLLAALAPLAGKLVESYDRVNEVLEKPAPANSSFSRLMLNCDRRLGTLGDRFFNFTRLGKHLDGMNELLTKSLFQVVSGVKYADAVGLSISQIQDGVEFRQQIRDGLSNASELRQKVKTKYSEKFDEFSKSAEGENALKKSRIKLLALIFNGLEFKNQLSEGKENLKSFAQITSAFLGTISTSMDIVTPAVEHGIKSKVGTTSVKFIGASAGTAASVISLGLDSSDLYSEITGHQRWSFVGLYVVKSASDIALVAKASEGLLKLLAERALIKQGVSDAVTKFVAIRFVSWLASWEVMLALFLVEQLMSIWMDNELQKWCRGNVFGLEPEDELQSTWSLRPKTIREKEYEDQLDEFQKALGAVL